MTLKKGPKVVFKVPLASGEVLEVSGSEPVPGLALHHHLFNKKTQWQISLVACGCRVLGSFDTQKQALGAIEAMSQHRQDWRGDCKELGLQESCMNAFVAGYQYLLGGENEAAS